MGLQLVITLLVAFSLCFQPCCVARLDLPESEVDRDLLRTVIEPNTTVYYRITSVTTQLIANKHTLYLDMLLRHDTSDATQMLNDVQCMFLCTCALFLFGVGVWRWFSEETASRQMETTALLLCAQQHITQLGQIIRHTIMVLQGITDVILILWRLYTDTFSHFEGSPPCWAFSLASVSKVKFNSRFKQEKKTPKILGWRWSECE